MHKAFFLFLFLVGCQYNLSNHQNTISVAAVSNDDEGLFTQQLVHAIASSSTLTYDPEGEYRLKISLQSKDQTIGFRREDVKVGSNTVNKLRKTEQRTRIQAKVSLQNAEGKILWGPYTIEEDADYDFFFGDAADDLSFVQNTRRITVLPFSLGQLQPQSSARQTALPTAYKKLARKIVFSIADAL